VIVKTKLKTHQIYSANTQQPMTPFLQAFDVLLKFPTLEPSTQMELRRVARQVQQQIEDVRQVHQGLLDTYLEHDEQGKPLMKPALDDDQKPIPGREMPTWKDESAFVDGLNSLLNEEFEINAIPASMLTKASDRYWLMYERGHTNGTMPLQLLPLEDLIYDDLAPKEEAPPENTTKPDAATKRQGRRRG
jgi:hypothetical protein